MSEKDIYQHTLKIYVDKKLYKELEWTGKKKHNKFYMDGKISLPQLSNVQIEYTNNFSKDSELLDLWNDFDINKSYAPWPYEYEEFLRFDTIIYIDEKPMRLFLAASHKINDTNDFYINNLVLQKAKVCVCGAINPSSISYIKDKIFGCSECK